MKSATFNLMRYDADENKVFDWKDLSAHVQTIQDEKTKEIKKEQAHLYAKTLYLAETDSIDNYVEVEMPATLKR